MPTREQLVAKYGPCTARKPGCLKAALHLGPCVTAADEAYRAAQAEPEYDVDDPRGNPDLARKLSW